MSELSRVEDLLKTGVEEPVLPMSRLEAILRGEKITPQSRVEELLLQYNPSDILIEKRITANGTYFAVNDNADGYFKVVVDTPVTPSVVLDHLVETITENGTYTYTPEHDGFEDAEITVNVSGGGGGQITPMPTNAFDTLVVNARYSTGSWDLEDGILSFNISEEDNSWTSFVSLRSIKKDFTFYKSLKFDVNLTNQEGYSEVAVIISPKYYNWGSSDWPGIFNESNKVVLYTTESGSYSIDTTSLAGGQYIYIIANTSDHEHRGNNYNGTIIGTVSNIKVEKLEITEYKQFRYCQFTSPARIDLPKLTQADSFDLDFECLTNYNDQSVFGTGGGPAKLHLTQYNNRWYTADNSGEVSFEGELLGRHVFTWNVYDSVNNLRASQFDGVTVVGNVETAADDQTSYLGYRSSDNHFNGVIYSYTVYRTIDGQRVDIMKLVPMRAYIEGTMAFEGFYDTVNDEWYIADGVVCGGGEAVADSHIYLMDGQVPGNQGTTYLEFDKPPVNGYYVISIYANNKSINNMVYFETGRNSDTFNFSPGSSGSYNCYIMWDNNKATVRIACNSGSWYTMHVRVTRMDDNYILNS